MTVLMLANEGTAIRRQVYFQCVDVIDGITARTNEAFNQPQISVDGAAFTNTGIGSLVGIGNGRYYAVIAQNQLVGGRRIETRYKSAATAETLGDSIQVVAFDPANPQNLGLGSLPLPSAGAASGLPLGNASGQVTVVTNLDKTGYSISGASIPTAQQIREEMDANSTHLRSMDNRIPGTPSTFAQIGTPGRGSVANELSQISAVADATYTKVPAISDIPTANQNRDAAWGDRAVATTTGTITTTSVPLTGSLSAVDDAYKGGFLLATSGALKGVGRKITAYVGSTTTCTTQAFPAALAVGVTVAIIGNVPT